MISTVLAGIIATSAGVEMIPSAFAKEAKNQTSINVDVELKGMSKAEKYFDWKNPQKKVRGDSLGLVKFWGDNQEKLLLTKLEGDYYEKYTIYDLDTDEPILRMNNYAGKQRVEQNFDYFEPGMFIKHLGILDLNYYDFDKKKESFLKPLFEGIVSLEQVAEIALLYEPNIDKWYNKNRLKSLDDLEYKNTVPSFNDNVLIPKEQLRMVMARNSRKDPTLQTLAKGTFTRIVDFEEEKKYRTKEFDIFTGEKVLQYEDGDAPTVFVTKNLKLEKGSYSNSSDVESSLWFFYELQEYTRPYRQTIEVVDGKEYYNTGKLRKLYENMLPAFQLDYSMYMDVLPKPLR